jgi:hypothetical protein
LFFGTPIPDEESQIGRHPVVAQRARTHDTRTFSVAFVCAIVAVVAVYFFLSAVAQSVVFDAVGIAAAGAMFMGMRRNRAEPRFGWILLAAGTLLMALGDVVFGTSQPVPSVADMLYVSAYVALTLGVVGIVRSVIPSRKPSSRLDAVIMAAGVGIVGILMLIIPASDPGAVGPAAKAVSLGYPAIDVTLLIGLIRLARRKTEQDPAFLLLIAGLVLRLAADAGYAGLNFGTTYVVGNALDALWLLSYACFGAALLHPAVGRVEVDTSSMWTERSNATVAIEPILYKRSASVIQWQALRFRTILATAGTILLSFAGVTIMLAVAWHAPEITLVSGAYGGSGMLILIASAVTS